MLRNAKKSNGRKQFPVLGSQFSEKLTADDADLHGSAFGGGVPPLLAWVAEKKPLAFGS
jgi:hypothetical protein